MFIRRGEGGGVFSVQAVNFFKALPCRTAHTESLRQGNNGSFCPAPPRRIELSRLAFDLLYNCAIKFRDVLATASKRTPHPIPLPSEGLCTTTSQNVRTPRKFFLVVLVLVLVLDWVSGLDCEDEDDDEDDSVAAAPLRARKFHRTRLRPNG